MGGQKGQVILLYLGMECITLIIAVIGAVTGVASFIWNIYTFRRNRADRREEKAEAERKELIIEPKPYNLNLKNKSFEIYISITLKNFGNKDLFIKKQTLVFSNEEICLPLYGTEIENVKIKMRTGILENILLKGNLSPEIRQSLIKNKKEVKLILTDHEGTSHESRPFNLLISA